RGRLDRGRSHRGGGAGGTVHAKEARRGIPAPCRRRLPPTGARPASRDRLRRLLRQAVPEIRETARNVSRIRPARLLLVPSRTSSLAQGEALPAVAPHSRTQGGRTHGAWDTRLLFSEHHLSHAASAFYPSPFERAAILTMDGVGEWTTTSLALGRGHDVTVLKEIHFPHSLGLLYSAFTYYTGFKVNSGE